jgi:hypothetical protein
MAAKVHVIRALIMNNNLIEGNRIGTLKTRAQQYTPCSYGQSS